MSLSGLSGVLAGVYALVGAGLAYLIMYGMRFNFLNHDHIISENGLMLQLAAIATIVLITALAIQLSFYPFAKHENKAIRYGTPLVRVCLRRLQFHCLPAGF